MADHSGDLLEGLDPLSPMKQVAREEEAAGGVLGEDGGGEGMQGRKKTEEGEEKGEGEEEMGDGREGGAEGLHMHTTTEWLNDSGSLLGPALSAAAPHEVSNSELSTTGTDDSVLIGAGSSSSFLDMQGMLSPGEERERKGSAEEGGYDRDSRGRPASILMEKRPSDVNFYVVKEGLLYMKCLFDMEGRKSEDRSWRKHYFVLQGPRLLLYKDMKASSVGNGHFGTITVEGSRAETYNEYKKKKHVFRLLLIVNNYSLPSSSTALHSSSSADIGDVTTNPFGEYLFQAKSDDEVAEWVGMINRNAKASRSELLAESEGNTLTKSNESINGGSSNENLHSSSSSNPVKKEKKSKLRFLKNFLTHRPTEDDLKTLGILGPEGGNGQKTNPLFGVDLQESLRGTNLSVPNLVRECVEAVEKKGGIETQGLYRLSGNSGDIQRLKALYDASPDHSVPDIESEELCNDIHVITGLLKLYFRELPSGLIYNTLYDRFIEAAKMEEYNEQMYAIKDLVHELPLVNFETLKYLIEHLSKVAANGEENKMMADNIGIVFGPTLMRPIEETMQSMVADMSFQSKVVAILVQACDWIFDFPHRESVQVKETLIESEGKGTMDDEPLDAHEDLIGLDLSTTDNTTMAPAAMPESEHPTSKTEVLLDRDLSQDNIVGVLQPTVTTVADSAAEEEEEEPAEAANIDDILGAAFVDAYGESVLENVQGDEVNLGGSNQFLNDPNAETDLPKQTNPFMADYQPIVEHNLDTTADHALDDLVNTEKTGVTGEVESTNPFYDFETDQLAAAVSEPSATESLNPFDTAAVQLNLDDVGVMGASVTGSAGDSEMGNMAKIFKDRENPFIEDSAAEEILKPVSVQSGDNNPFGENIDPSMAVNGELTGDDTSKARL
eukprot:Nk52_evm40s967 gene=Nk52_evmTU40s967